MAKRHLMYPLEFSKRIGVPLSSIRKVAAEADEFYKPFEKKVGKKIRTIANPRGALKSIQKQINLKILGKFVFPEYMVGGIKGKKLMDHLLCHVGSPVVVTLDIKSFFPSISNRKVYDAWIKHLQVNSDTASLATKLITYEGKVPLGAPTSTLIANLVLLPCLQEVHLLASSLNLNITQFVDDMAISGEKIPKDFILRVSKIYLKYGFRVNRKKTFIMYGKGRQIITKRVVNKKVGFSKNKKQELSRSVNKFFLLEGGTDAYERERRSLEGKLVDLKVYHPVLAMKLLERMHSSD